MRGTGSWGHTLVNSSYSRGTRLLSEVLVWDLLLGAAHLMLAKEAWKAGSSAQTMMCGGAVFMDALPP